MLVSVLMKKAWQYQLDARSTRMRNIPAGWAGQVDIEVAAAAIADGCAEPRGTPSPELAPRVAFYRRTLELHRTGLSLAEALNVAEAETVTAAAAADVETDTADASAPASAADHAAEPAPAAPAPPAPAASHSRKKKAAA